MHTIGKITDTLCVTPREIARARVHNAGSRKAVDVGGHETVMVSTALVLVTFITWLYWPTVQKLREGQIKMTNTLSRFSIIENFSDRR